MWNMYIFNDNFSPIYSIVLHTLLLGFFKHIVNNPNTYGIYPISLNLIDKSNTVGIIEIKQPITIKKINL